MVPENEIQKSMRAAIRLGDDAAFFRWLEKYPDQLYADSVFGSWLHFAASHGRLPIVKRLIASGIDPNRKGGVHNGNALHLAASDGYYDVVKYLMDCGAELDTGEPNRNPLFGAIHGGHTEIARLLIDAGIDTGVRYNGEYMKNMDALAFAREWGRTDIAEFIEAKRTKSHG